MTTIDFSNPAQMAALSFTLMLVIGISFAGGMIAVDGPKDGVVDLVVIFTAICFLMCVASTILFTVKLFLQHI